MKCPSCSATNPDSADWCGQCYASLATASPVVAQTVLTSRYEPAVDEVAATAPSPSQTPPDASSGREGSGDEGRFRKTPEGIQWRCRVCSEWNAVEALACDTCGTSFHDAVAQKRDDSPKRDLSDATAIAYSALLPGLTHILVGRTGFGIARAVMYVFFVIAGVSLLVSASSNNQSAIPALPLLVGALGLWVVSIYDGLIVAHGRRDEMLKPRMFFWLVVVVLAAVTLPLMTTAFSLQGSR